MAGKVGSCTVCFHARRRQIEAYMKQDANYGPILKWLRAQNRNDSAVRTYATKGPLKHHREICMGLEPLPSAAGGVQQAVVEVEDLPSDVTDAEITKRARRRLALRLDDLSAKELHTLVVEGMKLERERVRKAKDEDYDNGDEAKDDVSGAMASFDEAMAKKKVR